MALCKSSSPSHHLQTSFTIFQFSIFFILLLSHANAIFFNFSEFQPNENRIHYEGDAFSSSKFIQLTKNQRDANLTSSVGRASFSQAVRLWDAKTTRLTDFSTHFSFIIKALDENFYGDGLAFFLVPYNSKRPPNSVSAGGYLGLSSAQSAFNYTVNSTENAVVAVEFDSFKNEWDPSSDHVGINVNSIISIKNVTWNSSIKNGSRANAWVSYNSTTLNLSVFLSYAENPVFSGNSSLFHIVDLRDVLPEWVSVGFSASTGQNIEIHNIVSWDFSSSLEISDEGRNKKSKTGLVVGLVVGFSVLFGFGVGLTLFFRRKKKVLERSRNDDMNSAIYMDDEFEKGTGPKRFSYDELARATGNFNEEGKLGEGGFGGVYKGYIGELNLNIAVKRVSSGSKQGKKEYVSEVRIISRLRHRNLVQLIGWSHERGEFLLVYEFMPNGSLDYHLFRRESMLTWAVRYKIALGLASALLYLHEEWEQCVVHRDIKSSNVMLDSSFNAKLGDFGLARLVDHESGSQTTVVAGTMGYLAPECVTTGKSSKESDVYSFGIVALEIACGRRPVEQNKVNLVEWVWELYGKSNLIEAIDKRLSMDFVEAQTECLMVVGLWCAHPDHNARPSIRQVINVLNFGSPLPILPSKLPTPVYFAPPMGFNTLLFSSSNDLTDSTDNTDTSSKFTMSSKSSSSPSASLLHSQANI